MVDRYSAALWWRERPARHCGGAARPRQRGPRSVRTSHGCADRQDAVGEIRSPRSESVRDEEVVMSICARFRAGCAHPAAVEPPGRERAVHQQEARGLSGMSATPIETRCLCRPTAGRNGIGQNDRGDQRSQLATACDRIVRDVPIDSRTDITFFLDGSARKQGVAWTTHAAVAAAGPVQSLPCQQDLPRALSTSSGTDTQQRGLPQPGAAPTRKGTRGRWLEI